MRYIIVIIVLLLMISFMIFIFNNKTSKIKEIKNITSFNFSYTKGYFMNADIRYEVLCKEECIAKIKPYAIDESDIVNYIVDNSFIEKLENILNKYEVIKWDNFNEHDPNVLDGDSFSFSVSFGDININASGYMMYPNNYRYVKEELDKLFNSLMEK